MVTLQGGGGGPAPNPSGGLSLSSLSTLGSALVGSGDGGQGGGGMGVHGGAGAAVPASGSNEACGIREVWSHNLEEEFRVIAHLIFKYPYVAMDTEFPGVVARPVGDFRSSADYQYQLLRCNVDLLKIIQLGMTFMDEKGNLPESGISTWQFNFRFNLTEDMYAEDSVDLLRNSGIQFEKHEQEGIDPHYFAELMLMSGLVLLDNVRWLSFHSGYDFGYLLGLLTNQNLPKTEGEFFESLKTYFPVVYDVKYLMGSCKNLKGGLQEVANELEVRRIGPQHQAGSDSLLTGQTFFKMREMFFEDDIDDSKYCGYLFGLGANFVVTSTATSTSSSSTAAATTVASGSGAADANDGNSGGDGADAGADAKEGSAEGSSASGNSNDEKNGGEDSSSAAAAANSEAAGVGGENSNSGGSQQGADGVAAGD